MSLLRSVSFGIENGMNSIPLEVLGLFADMPEKERTELEYVSEIIQAGMRGKINTSCSFNARAYVAEIKKRKKLKQSESNEVAMVGDFEDEAVSSTSLYKGTVTQEYASNHTVEKMVDAYDKLVDEDELKNAVKLLKELNLALAAKSGVNIIEAMKAYLLYNVPGSDKNIKTVCDRFPVVSEMVTVILSSGRPFTELFSDCI